MAPTMETWTNHRERAFQTKTSSPRLHYIYRKTHSFGWMKWYSRRDVMRIALGCWTGISQWWWGKSRSPCGRCFEQQEYHAHYINHAISPHTIPLIYSTSRYHTWMVRVMLFHFIPCHAPSSHLPFIKTHLGPGVLHRLAIRTNGTWKGCHDWLGEVEKNVNIEPENGPPHQKQWN